MLKAVVDTNVLVSGTILSRGNPYQVLEEWRRSQFILVLSSDIIAEIEAVLRRPKIFKKYGLTENLLTKVSQRSQRGSSGHTPWPYRTSC